MIITKNLVAVAALSLLLPSHTLAWSGTAITGPDNATLKVQRKSEQITPRLYGIKPPDASQSFLSQAKKATTALVKGRTVAVNELTTDEHGQPVALVYISGQNLTRISHEFFNFRLNFLIFIENTVALNKQTVFSSIIKKLMRNPG